MEDNETMAVFKSFLRTQLRLLKELKEALDNKDFARANKITDELIEDTQKGIED